MRCNKLESLPKILFTVFLKNLKSEKKISEKPDQNGCRLQHL